jgi:hypothetical protein
MPVEMGGGPPRVQMDTPTADQVTITRTNEGGFAVECLRDGAPEVSTWPDIGATMDYVNQELTGAPPEGPPPAPEGPPMAGPDPADVFADEEMA